MEFKEIEDKERVYRFIIDDLAPGEGETLGNFFRRYLVLSARCFTPIAVKLHVGGKLVNSPFTVSEGITEDIFTITMNAKEVRFCCSDGYAKDLVLETAVTFRYSGRDKILTAGMLIPSNPEVYISEDTKDRVILNNPSEESIDIEFIVAYQQGLPQQNKNLMLVKSLGGFADEYQVFASNHSNIIKAHYNTLGDNNSQSGGIKFEIETTYGYPKNTVVEMLNKTICLLTDVRDRMA